MDRAEAGRKRNERGWYHLDWAVKLLKRSCQNILRPVSKKIYFNMSKNLTESRHSRYKPGKYVSFSKVGICKNHCSPNVVVFRTNFDHTSQYLLKR